MSSKFVRTLLKKQKTPNRLQNNELVSRALILRAVPSKLSLY